MISSRAKYATRALLELAIRYDQGPVGIHDIAEAQNIPVKFLEQILLSLKAGGMVNSRKGPGGGYLLTARPQDITLGMVVRAIDGPLSPISCVSVTRYEPCGCPEPEICGLRQAWKAARDAIAAVLDQTNFAEIRNLHLDRKRQRDDVLDYVI